MSAKRVGQVGIVFAWVGFALAAGMVGCVAEDENPSFGSEQSPVIYGTDNRSDVYAYSLANWRDRALQSTVALVQATNINMTNPNNVLIAGSTLQSAYSLCSDQRFLTQPTGAFCSGTLIDDDIVLTAGHCITSRRQCSSTRFVFKYAMSSATTRETITSADVFSCSSILYREETTTVDYALIRLDRRATPRFVPAPVRTTAAAVTGGASLSMIGCPSGIPFKIDDGGSVRSNRATTLDYFIATTDSFGGNSGSGVYLQETGELAGILVRGETDYLYYGAPSYCYRVNVCSETGCGGEDVTYAHRAIQPLCAGVGSARLCGSPAVCGNGNCEAGESSVSCPADCGAVCGDGTCNGGETSATCPADCGSAGGCGDGICAGVAGGENCLTCATDCACVGAGCRRACCGDGVCTLKYESAATCDADC